MWKFLGFILLLVAVVWGILALVIWLSKGWAKYGERKESARQKQRELDAIREGNKVRDRMQRDDDYAKRVRDRFTR